MANISPVVIERVKKARGRVRIVENNGICDLMILENNSWVTVLSNQPRRLVEEAISCANRNVILG